MSNRIAVIADGQLQQIGSAREIYEAPKNKFVADFIGETNLIDVEVSAVIDGHATCILPGGTKFTCPAAEGASKGAGHLSVRPERVAIQDAESGLISGTTSRHIYLGTDMHVDVTLDDGEVVTVRVQNSETAHIPEMGTRVGLNFEAGAARLLVD
jgi:spermidine/putrescine transport system ATP-binding protein